jgi:hypothetical protein
MGPVHIRAYEVGCRLGAKLRKGANLLRGENGHNSQLDMQLSPRQRDLAQDEDQDNTVSSVISKPPLLVTPPGSTTSK